MSRRLVTTRWSCASEQMLPVRPMIHLSGRGFGQYGSISNVCVLCAASNAEAHAASRTIEIPRIVMRMHHSLHVVEEIDDPGFQRVLRADNDEAILFNQLLEELRPMSQLTDGESHISTHGVVHERVGIALRFQQRLDRWTDAVDDGPQVSRLGGRRLLQLFDRGENRAALRMAEHDDQTSAVTLGGKFDAADLRWGDDVTRNADDKQIPESLVEHDLGGHTRV